MSNANPFRLSAVICFLGAAVDVGFGVPMIARLRQGLPVSELGDPAMLAAMAAAVPLLIAAGLGLLQCRRWAHWLVVLGLASAGVVFFGPWVLPLVAAALWFGQLAQFRSARSRSLERQVDAIAEILGINWGDFPLKRIEAARRQRAWDQALNELRGSVDLDWDAVEDLMALWPCNAVERKLLMLARRLRLEFEQMEPAAELPS